MAVARQQGAGVASGGASGVGAPGPVLASRVEAKGRSGDRPWAVEAHGIDAISDDERHGRPLDLFWIWSAANISVLNVTYGGYLVVFYRLDLWQAAVACVTGVVVSFLVVGLISLAGKRSGAPTLVLSRASFGVVGNALPTLVSYATLVGFEVVLTSLAALAVQTVLARLGLRPGGPGLLSALGAVFLVSAGLSLLGHATIQRALTWCTVAFGVLTVVFVGLEAGKVDWRAVASLPQGKLLAGLVAGLSIVMAGTGLTWANAAADYSRYLPRASSSSRVVFWTVFGASLPLLVLIMFGALLAASDPAIAMSSDPVGLLARALPTWFLVPYLLSAVGGLVAEVVMGSYSGGLNLLALGARVARYKSVLVDSALVTAGCTYLLFFARSFFAPFEGLLETLASALSAWAAVFLADMWLFRRDGYDDKDLYRARGRYGAVNVAGLSAFVLGTALGWGTLTSTSAVFSWTGYLLRFVGGPKGPVGSSDIGVLFAFALSGGLYAAFGRYGAQPRTTPGPATASGLAAARPRAGQHARLALAPQAVHPPAPMPAPRRLVVVGSVVVDVLMYLDELPSPGSAALARGAVVAPGAGYNLLDAAVKLGLPAAHLGFVGSGPFGAMVRGALNELDVPVLLPPPAEGDTGFDVGLVKARADCQPSFVGAPGVESTLRLRDLQSAALRAADTVYVSGYDLCYPGVGAALGEWLPTLADDILFVFDPGPMVSELPQALLAKVLGRADIVSANHEEARWLVGPSADHGNPRSLARSLASSLRAGAWAVLRVGAQGCWVALKGGGPTYVPGRPASVVDTTGAGDSHLGCLLARLAAGDPMPTAAAWANVAASLSVERRGPATGPTAAELARYADEVATVPTECP